MGLPYIGESVEFLKKGRNGKAEEFVFDRVSKYSSQVFKTSILGQPTVVVSGAEANKFLFSNENKLVQFWMPDSVNRIFISPKLKSIPNEEAMDMRKMLTLNFLRIEALATYIGAMETIALQHLDSSWRENLQFKAFHLTDRYTFAVSCRVLISLEDPGDVSKFADNIKAVASGMISVPVNLPWTRFNKAIKAADLVRNGLMDIMKQRKIHLQEDPGHAQDILSHMLLATDDNGKHMNELVIADRVLSLLVVGHDTTSAVITFTIKYLADLPHIYSQVFQEQMEVAEGKREGELIKWEDIQKMKKTWNVVSEVMRLLPPNQGYFREALQDFTISGFTVPKGWKVSTIHINWSVYSTHKDPQWFPEPEKFDPTRFEGKGPAAYTYVPFGGGPRMCPAKEYARIEVLVFIHHLVRRFKWELILPLEKIVMDPFPKPADGLPIRLVPHSLAC